MAYRAFPNTNGINTKGHGSDYYRRFTLVFEVSSLIVAAVDSSSMRLFVHFTGRCDPNIAATKFTGEY